MNNDNRNGHGEDRDRKPFGERKSYGDRDSKPFGERKSYGDRDRKPFGERKSYGDRDRKPFGERKSYGDRDSKPFGERKSYGDRDSKPFGERKSYGDRDSKPFGERKSYGDRDSKPFGERKSYGDRDRKPFGERKSYGDRDSKPFGERKSYGDRDSKPFGERKSDGDRDSKPFGERKSYGDRDRKPFGERKSYGDRDRKPFGERKSYGDRDSKPFGERKSYGDRDNKPFGERKSYGDRDSKPFGERKSYGDRDSKPFGERKSYGDRDSKPFGERKSYGDRERKPFGERDGEERRSYSSTRDRKPFGERFEPRENREDDHFFRPVKRSSLPGLYADSDENEKVIRPGKPAVRGDRRFEDEGDAYVVRGGGFEGKDRKPRFDREERKPFKDDFSAKKRDWKKGAAELAPAKFPGRKPELLAPVGNREMLRAAIENGADSVYFGLGNFNARLRGTNNFDTDELPLIMRELHERGVNGFVTLNTLIFTPEIEAAAMLATACNAAGTDAVLVQDLGLSWLMTRLTPEMPQHASTQTALTCGEAVQATRAIGLNFQRVVAPRELSVNQLGRMVDEGHTDVEAFVHGALCMGYSGLCTASECLGGRSANRGMCAQACRLPYTLTVDGAPLRNTEVQYPLSPHDLCAFPKLGEMISAGVTAMKIEGRLKSARYVAAAVSAYRRGIDDAFPPHNQARPINPEMSNDTRRRLEMTFSRGFCTGHLEGTNHRALVDGRSPKSRGMFIGKVVFVNRVGDIEVELVQPLRRGDGVAFECGDRAESNDEGGKVWDIGRGRQNMPEVQASKDSPLRVMLGFGKNAIKTSRIEPGMRVWKTSDVELEQILDATIADSAAGQYKRPVVAEVEGDVGENLKLTMIDSFGNEATVFDTEPADWANEAPLNEEFLEMQIGRLGTTPLRLRRLEANIGQNVMIPVRRLNNMRREAVEKIMEMRREKGLNRPCHESALAELRAELREEFAAEFNAEPAPRAETKISALCRTVEQVQACMMLGGLDTIYVEFDNPQLYAQVRELIPDSCGTRFAPATLRAVKPGEGHYVRGLLNYYPDSILVRGLGAWQLLQQSGAPVPMTADFSMNIVNDLTAGLLRRSGFERLTPGTDMDTDTTLAMIEQSCPAWFEPVLYQKMPMFYTEHCLFCAHLSPNNATRFPECGRQCEYKALTLRDRKGVEHPVRSDDACRNIVYSGEARDRTADMQRFIDAGVRRFRVDFVDEDSATVRNILRQIRETATGE